jgi:hypothetical protein
MSFVVGIDRSRDYVELRCHSQSWRWHRLYDDYKDDDDASCEDDEDDGNGLHEHIVNFTKSQWEKYGLKMPENINDLFVD